MPGFDKILHAIGPNSAIIFAAWAAMQFLQARFNTAYTMYQDAVEKFRTQEDRNDAHGRKLKRQAELYHKRCHLMSRATRLGMVAAMLLIAGILFGMLDAFLPKREWVIIAGSACSALGFLCVLGAAAIVLAEGIVTERQIDNSAEDVPELGLAR